MNILSNIPNIPHSDVPNGKDENDNIEILNLVKFLNLILNLNLIMN